MLEASCTRSQPLKTKGSGAFRGWVVCKPAPALIDFACSVYRDAGFRDFFAQVFCSPGMYFCA